MADYSTLFEALIWRFLSYAIINSQLRSTIEIYFNLMKNFYEDPNFLDLKKLWNLNQISSLRSTRSSGSLDRKPFARISLAGFFSDSEPLDSKSSNLLKDLKCLSIIIFGMPATRRLFDGSFHSSWERKERTISFLIFLNFKLNFIRASQEQSNYLGVYWGPEIEPDLCENHFEISSKHSECRLLKIWSLESETQTSKVWLQNSQSKFKFLSEALHLKIEFKSLNFKLF